MKLSCSTLLYPLLGIIFNAPVLFPSTRSPGFFAPSKGHESGLQPEWGHPFTHKWCRQSLGRKLAWSPHLEQLCVWQTFGLLTTHRQGPSCSTGVCQLGTQMGLWESQSGVYQSLDVTPLSQTSMPPLSQRAIFTEMSFSGVVGPLRWTS